MIVSVVIPVLNESAVLPSLLRDLRALNSHTAEIVVVDAGSTDDTVALALAAGARVVQAPRGRASQMNAGARTTHGEWLLFLHADSRLDREGIAAVERAIEGPDQVDAAVFRFQIDLPPRSRWLIEKGQAIREALTGLAYGDQGLLVRRHCFVAVGGYPDTPLMEDVVIIRRLRRHCSVSQLHAPLRTSGRRYQEHGVFRTWLVHTLFIALYAVGVSPIRLAHWRDGTPVTGH